MNTPNAKMLDTVSTSATLGRAVGFGDPADNAFASASAYANDSPPDYDSAVQALLAGAQGELTAEQSLPASQQPQLSAAQNAVSNIQALVDAGSNTVDTYNQAVAWLQASQAAVTADSNAAAGGTPSGSTSSQSNTSPSTQPTTPTTPTAPSTPATPTAPVAPPVAPIVPATGGIPTWAKWLIGLVIVGGLATIGVILYKRSKKGGKGASKPKPKAHKAKAPHRRRRRHSKR
jgi:hypothetical protein